MVEHGYVSGYLKRPPRTLRRACIEFALRQGRARPDCGPCPFKDFCALELRRLRRAQKQAVLAAGRSRAPE